MQHNIFVLVVVAHIYPPVTEQGQTSDIYPPVTEHVTGQLLDDPHTFHCIDYFVIGGIRTCLGVSDDPMFQWISLNSCPLSLQLVQSHQAEIIIVTRLIQGRNSVTRVRVEPASFDQSRRKNDAFTLSTTPPTMKIAT